MTTKNKKTVEKQPTITRRPRKDGYSEEDKKIACSDLPISEIASLLGRFKADGTPNDNVILQLRTKLKSEGYDVQKTRSWSRKNNEVPIIPPSTIENRTSKQFKFFVDGVEFKIAAGVKSVEVDKEGVRIEL